MSGELILVVEDSRIVAKDIEKRLEQLGYRVAGTATSGRVAIEKAELTSPDLVLMDIRLKGRMDGIDAAREIQSRLGTPIVYLTAHADEETLSRVKPTLPHGYIVKPFEANALHTAIEVALVKASMERRLQESERWLRTVLHSIADATIATAADGAVRLVNPAAEELTGWSEREAAGQHWSGVVELLDHERHGPARDPVALALQEGRTVELARVLLVNRSGSEIPVELTAAPIVDERGGRQGLVLVMRDATEREIRKQALQRSHDLLEAVVGAAGDGIFLKSLGGRFLLVNPAAARALGASEREIVGSSDEEAFSPAVASLMKQAQERAVATGRPQSFECSLTTAEGKRSYLFSEAICRDRRGEALGVVCLARDLTGLDRGDAERDETARAVGALAHELSQSLAELEDSLRATRAPVTTMWSDQEVEAARSRIGAVARELSSLHLRARSSGGHG